MYQVCRILELKINKHTKSTFSTAALEQHYFSGEFHSLFYLIVLINIAFIILYINT